MSANTTKLSIEENVFGQRLRAARERIGMPQDKLGVAIGLDESASSARISRYETGVHLPPYEIARKLAETLDVPVAYLYCDDEQFADLLLRLSKLNRSKYPDLCALIDSAEVSK